MKNILLYLSAFMPMYVLITVKQVFELAFGREKWTWLSLVVFIFLFVVIALGVWGLLAEIFNKKEKSTTVEILTKDNITDRHFLGYFSLFVLFAITFDLSRLSMFVVFVLILVMIGIVYVKNKLFFINPFLNILGYNFYAVTYRLGDGAEKHTHIFYRGALEANKTYRVKIKDENFAFIVR